jgi:hypothetical protein
MADSNSDRNTESFALGLIIAVIVYLILRRELGSRFGLFGGGAVTGRGSGAGAGGAGGAGGFFGGGGSGKSGGCGCCTSSNANPLPTNPGISIGGQSLNPTPFGSSSVHQVTEFYGGPPNPNYESVN